MTKAGSTSTPSRRALLQGAAAVAVLAPAATIGAAAIASMPDPLIALCDKWREALTSPVDPIVAMMARRDELKRLAVSWWAKTNAIEDALPPRDDPGFAEALRACNDAVSERTEIADRPIWDIEEKIAATPATTMAGARAKARLLIDLVIAEHPGWDGRALSLEEWFNGPTEVVALYLALDIERLAGGAT